MIAINLLVYYARLDIIVLDRSNLRPPPQKSTDNISARIASRDDLIQMQDDGGWDITEAKWQNFSIGDSCLLSYMGGDLAGYTWVHTEGHPELVPGLVINVPAYYLYNYAGFTHPDFRGRGLQGYRHHSVMEQWPTAQTLLGFVDSLNFSSKRGQGKSGYRTIGSIWLLGSRKRSLAYFSRSLRELGIKRLSAVTRQA